tara:strand:- start:746 stop:937 length:192 start_codon:yes stop_codon:yes gene_type:complete
MDDKLEYQFREAFLEQESEKFIEYLCERRTKEEVYAAIEKIALLQLQIKNCEDIIYASTVDKC